MAIFSPYPQTDLEQIAMSLGRDVYELKYAKILITGGSGFVGTWLISALLYLDTKYSLNLRIVSNSRTFETYTTKFSKEVIGRIEILTGDVANLNISEIEFDFVFHGSTSTIENSLSLEINSLTSSSAFAAENLIQQISRKKKGTIFVHLSSGAVYGPQFQDFEPRKAFEPTQEETKNNSFSERYQDAKVKTERIVQDSSESNLIVGVNARLFAFYGPGLPVNQQFAIGNFMRDALSHDKVIKVLGNPDSIRSYMHASDLTYCLIKLAIERKPGNFNVGSPDGDSIINWARKVAKKLGAEVSIETINPQISFYVPDMQNSSQMTFIPRLDFEGYIEDWAFWLMPQL
ncbi:WcaG Nucleoside-diphosphate-sugar epimerases [Candidatus Nanopelagicaceae bacterium]